ncbi:MAG: cyclic nucleotide-binding domain-containing protein [Gallionella sp.]|nr:cyclic nucleotide-binding domain-containing protein [Gallionella sp.]
MKPISSMLRLSPITEELSDDEVDLLMSMLVADDFSAGDLICLPKGIFQDSLFIVMSGGIEVRLNSPEGVLTVHAIKPGDIANTIAFMGGNRFGIDSRLYAEGATSVLRLDRNKLEEHLYTHPVLVYRLTRGITRYVHGRLRYLSGELTSLNQLITCADIEPQMRQGDAVTRAMSSSELVMG